SASVCIIVFVYKNDFKLFSRAEYGPMHRCCFNRAGSRESLCPSRNVASDPCPDRGHHCRELVPVGRVWARWLPCVARLASVLSGLHWRHGPVLGHPVLCQCLAGAPMVGFCALADILALLSGRGSGLRRHAVDRFYSRQGAGLFFAWPFAISHRT